MGSTRCNAMFGLPCKCTWLMASLILPPRYQMLLLYRSPVRGANEACQPTWAVDNPCLLQEAEGRPVGPDQAAAMEDMDRELRELTERIDFNTQRHPGPPGGRDMTFEEKRRLSIGLGNLPGDKVERVLEIIAVRHAAGLGTDLPWNSRNSKTTCCDLLTWLLMLARKGRHMPSQDCCWLRS